MSIAELEQIDNYLFYIRTVSNSWMKRGKIHMSSCPFYSRANGICYDMSMLRDVEYSFKYKCGKKMTFEIYAVERIDGEKTIDTNTFLYNNLMWDENTSGDDDRKIVKICQWSMCLEEDENGGDDLKTYSRKWMKCTDDVRVHWWINVMRKNDEWYFSNPEMEIKTSLLIKKLC